jgi:alanine racemase
MPRPIYAVIHQASLRHNLNIARQTMPDSKVFAVVKANAYGHGIERVYSALSDADGFAFLDIDEAKRLRALGCNKQLLLLEGIFHYQDLFECHSLNLSFTIHSEHQLKFLERFAIDMPDAKFDIFLKMNSGMNRLGFQPEEYTQAWTRLNALNIVKNITHMTHFSDADSERFGEDGVLYQQQTLNKIIGNLTGKTSISNSAAILRHAHHVRSDYIRSGIMLYGSSPDYPTHSIQDWNLKPSMSLRSEILAVQNIKAGDCVGYGSTFIAEQEMRIGIVACGYADGYQRMSPTGTPILVDSIRTHTLGRVSMDMLMVDLSHIKHAKIGSEVVLWGISSQGVVLPIDEVAKMSGTTGYELMCGVMPRVNFVVAS